MVVLRTMLSTLILLTFAGAGTAQTQASVDNLSWLSGCWEGRQGEAIIEEIWSKPAGKSMFGLGRTLKNNRTVSFEFMQFREEKGSLVFLPQPQGGTRVPFPLKAFSGDKMTFENPDHDYPQRIIYERKGKGLLLASTEGLFKGKLERKNF